MQVLLTGGAGFIGSHTADALLREGCSVRVLDSLEEPVHPGHRVPEYLDKRIEFIRGDVRDANTLLEAMRGDDTTWNIPVIIISIRKDDEAYQKARQFGACAYLQKPLDAAELVATVKRVLADPTPM